MSLHTHNKLVFYLPCFKALSSFVYFCIYALLHLQAYTKLFTHFCFSHLQMQPYTQSVIFQKAKALKAYS